MMEAADTAKPTGLMKGGCFDNKPSKSDTLAYNINHNPYLEEYEQQKNKANNRLRWGFRGNKWFGYHPEENGGNISPTKFVPDFYGRKGRIDDHYSGRQEFLYSDGPTALPQYDQRTVAHFRNNDSYKNHGEHVYNRVTFCVDHPYAWDRNGLCRTCNRPWQLP